MDTRPAHDASEQDEVLVRDFSREAEVIAEAKAQFAAGRFIEEEDADAWLDSLGTASERPPPNPRG